MVAPDWLFYDDAISEFSSKFQDQGVAVSLFRHCLQQGFIRARCETVTRNGKAVPKRASFKTYIDDEGLMAPDAWDYVNFDAPANKEGEGSFALKDPWGSEPLASVHGVRYNRHDIAKLVSRKGAGGAPFKKVHWMRMTSTLLDLVLTGQIEQFQDFPSFLTYLDEEVNGSGDGLDRSSLRHPAEQLWNRITRQRQNAAG